jgi:hypothetical protein
MVIVFYVSLALLFLTFSVRHFELERGGRSFELARTCLDRTTIKIGKKLQNTLKRSLEYAHKDIILNGLHMVTYLALLLVRLVERKLEMVTVFLRSFRRHKNIQKKVNPLKHITRESIVRFEEEQNL